MNFENINESDEGLKLNITSEINKQPSMVEKLNKPQTGIQMERNNKTQGSQLNMVEWFKCKLNLRYFAENYVYIPVTGANIKFGDSPQYNSTVRYKILLDLFQQHDAVSFLSSRQQGKTTNIAIYIVWAMIFFPKLQISFLTIDKNRALDFISRCKEIMDFLPSWLKIPQKGTAEKLTYYELKNGSKVSASYVSGSIDPDKVGRGLSNPIVIMDEVAFIPHAETVWAAVQPSLSAAKIHAKANGYPSGVIFTTTPNGGGDNFFFKIYSNAVQFDDIYDYENDKLYENYQEEFEKDGKNAFLSLTLHWSETRSEEWYEEQKKELNYDTRKINQELDLVFLGSENSIFDDSVIAKFIPKKHVQKFDLTFNSHFYMYTEELPKDGFYILGIDVASSTGINSDFSAMVLIDGYTGLELGYFKYRFNILKRFGVVVKETIHYLIDMFKLDEDNFQVIIERNNVGKAIIEDLVYAPDDDMNYLPYLFQERAPGQKDDVIEPEMVYGVWTSNSKRAVSSQMQAGKRDKMFTYLQRTINENPDVIQSNELQFELRNLVQKPNGRIEASRGQHDDLVMAYNFTLYAREILIKSGAIIVDGEDRAMFRVSPAQLIDYMSIGLMHNPAVNPTITPQNGSVNFDDMGSIDINSVSSVNSISSTDIISFEENVLVKEHEATRRRIAKENGYDNKAYDKLTGTDNMGFNDYVII